MSVILLRLRSELRNRWRAWLGLALLLGLAGGAATAAAAGARRTESAYPRFVAAQKGYDLLTGGFPDSIDPEKALPVLERLPSVKEWARLDFLSAAGILPSGKRLTNPQIAAATDLQGRAGFELNRFKVLSGRAFDLNAPHEAMVDFGTADKYDLKLGSVVRFVIGDFADPKAKLYPVRIVGIVAYPGSFPAVGISSFFTTIQVTPAFARVNHITPYAGDSGLLIRLKGGSSGLPSFFKEKAAAGLGKVDVPVIEKVQTAGVQRSIRFEVQALWVLGALITLTALAILGQSLARQTSLDSDELPTLRAIGVSRRQLFALGLTRATVIGTAAALIAVPIAVLLSPLAPIGLARLAEPTPGVRIDGPVLLAGSALVLVLSVALSILPSMRSARSAGTSGSLEPDRERPSGFAGALGRASSSPSAVAGLRMALEPGRGRTAVPVRSAIFGSAISVAALTAALLFATSLHHVLNTPRLSGFTWDAFVSAEADDPADSAALVRTTAAAFRADPLLAGFSRGGYINVKIAGISLFGVTVGGGGPAHPIISEGRAPKAGNEIALGAGTLRATHTSIGDSVRVAVDDQDHPAQPVLMKIVGKAIIPPSPFGISRPGDGVAISFAGWSSIDPGAIERAPFSPFLVRYAPGVSEVDGLAAVRRDAPTAFIIPAERPGDVSSLVRISDVPILLSGLLALIALGTLAHTLVTSIRRRRRDLAILKTIGFVRGQLSGAVAWQATTLAAFALLIGVPVGVAVGRWSWRLFADQLGVLPDPIIPTIAVLVAIPAGLLLANLIAALPGRSAARTRAAHVLRSE
jgi:ABC-type antimicrobial peptide transport system permease subunit